MNAEQFVKWARDYADHLDESGQDWDEYADTLHDGLNDADLLDFLHDGSESDKWFHKLIGGLKNA